MDDRIQEQDEEDDTLIHWQQQSSYEIMTDEFWDNFPHLAHEREESFTCYEDDIDKREDDGNLYRPIDYFTSHSFDSWCKHFDECNSFLPAQYDLRDGDEVWCYKVQTTDFIPIGFEITIPYNFISEKNYFNEEYAEKYGRMVAFRNGTTDGHGYLTLGHVIAIERGTEKPYDRRMVLVRTHGYGKLTNDTLESWIFKKYKIKDHYHYITYYHKALNLNNYSNDEHVKNCLRCDDCFYEMARVIKNEWNIDLPLRSIVDGITRKSVEVYISGLINYTSDMFKDILKRWYFMYDPYQLMVKIFCNFREIDDFTGSRTERFQLYTKPQEFIRRFKILSIEEMIVRDKFKCIRCSEDLFKVSDVECFSNEGTTVFRVNPNGEIHQLRTFKNCISGAVSVSGLPNPSMTYFEGYKWRFLHCTNCHGFLGWRFESRVFTPSIFYSVLDRSIFPYSSSSLSQNLSEMDEIWQRNRILCNYYFTRDFRSTTPVRPSIFDDTDLDFVTSEFEDPLLNRFIESLGNDLPEPRLMNGGNAQQFRNLNQLNQVIPNNEGPFLALNLRDLIDHEIVELDHNMAVAIAAGEFGNIREIVNFEAMDQMEEDEIDDLGWFDFNDDQHGDFVENSEEEEDNFDIEGAASLHGSESIDGSDSVNDDSSSDIMMDDVIGGFDNNSETNSVNDPDAMMDDNNFGENEDTRSREGDSDTSYEMEHDNDVQMYDNDDVETGSRESDNGVVSIYENDYSDNEDGI
uniref:CULT domain-containing protein n=1 Tax=Strongyloides venezuelensis TaxID=75913 RepID=A0A0K0FNX2_STRVS